MQMGSYNSISLQIRPLLLHSENKLFKITKRMNAKFFIEHRILTKTFPHAPMLCVVSLVDVACQTVDVAAESGTVGEDAVEPCKVARHHFYGIANIEHGEKRS